MDVWDLRDFVFGALGDPLGELGCAETGKHDVGLSMFAGVTYIQIDGQEFELRIEPVEQQGPFV